MTRLLPGACAAHTPYVYAAARLLYNVLMRLQEVLYVRVSLPEGIARGVLSGKVELYSPFSHDTIPRE